MRVLMVTDFYAPYVGGVEQHVRSLAHALADRGHHVAVATLWTPEAGPEQEDDGPVRVHRLRSTAQRLKRRWAVDERPWAPPVVDPGVLLGLRRVVRAERPDVVHGHDWLGRSAWPLCLRRRPLVVSLHYYSRSCAKKTLVRDGRRCEGPAPLKCARCAAGHYGRLQGPAVAAANLVGAAVDDRVAAAMVAVSGATAAGNLLPSRRRSCVVVPNLLPPPDGDWDGTGLDALPDGPFVLYVGDLRAEKGLDVLLDAYRGMPAPAPPLVLVGKRVPASPATLPDGVRHLGTLPNEAVLEAWRRCSFGVVPSVWAEPFGIVVIEAMTAGRPVVASAVGGLAEIVTDGVDGVLVPPGDAVALRAAIARLAGDPVLRARLGAAAARTAARYRPSVVAAEVEAVYEGALAGRG
ncbi:MAG TPA: glycosyltransferase [Acidimicrobiales bacterium]